MSVYTRFILNLCVELLTLAGARGVEMVFERTIFVFRAGQKIISFKPFFFASLHCARHTGIVQTFVLGLKCLKYSPRWVLLLLACRVSEEYSGFGVHLKHLLCFSFCFSLLLCVFASQGVIIAIIIIGVIMSVIMRRTHEVRHAECFPLFRLCVFVSFHSAKKRACRRWSLLSRRLLTLEFSGLGEDARLLSAVCGRIVDV